ncbi:MAG: Gfo/Idh/MocA family oxidoreductase [Oscillospiraceae bacterium]|jgi:predicted dehydrogenase|nr:Gfo/Idh/MocA family oxidoreductase [Oscillospiraceae bacterium]
MNVGILGTGWIAERLAKTLIAMADEGFRCAAAGSRSLEKAQKFIKDFGLEGAKAYGSYEELAKDSDIDLIYIATPHSHHFLHAKLCMEKGRNVLVEKAFTINAAEARELVEIARERKLLLAEAIWTRYMPSRFALEKMLAAKIIGEPYMLLANLGYNNIHMERMYKPELAGGALLDLGVYAINFALSAFGNDIDYIESSADLHESGVDLHDRITIYFKGGKYAQLYASLDEFTDKKGIIRGDKGWLEFENINNCEWIRAHIDGANTVHFDVPEQITGLEYQLMACKKAIGNGEIECPEMPHDEIIRVMEIMDSLRKNWGVKYPMEN